MNQESLLHEMNDRSREVFRRVVESYLETGEPVGSRTLTRALSEKVSAATIRNVMQDLEFMGLLDSPHASAGRLPSQMGLRLFVDGMMEIDAVNSTDRAAIDQTLGNDDPETGVLLDRVSTALSSITRGASLVLMPKHEAPIRHMNSSAWGRIGRWWFWSLPTAMSKTASLPRRPARPRPRCARPAIS